MSESDSYAYEAQRYDGRPVAGTIEAASAEEARRQLTEFGLRPLALKLATAARGGALSRDDFMAFNQQLAHLTAAGMPIEGGLRLIARDLSGGRLARTIEEVAAAMESGQSLGEAFEAHRGRFPMAYGHIIDAGVRSGRLSQVLLNLGRQLELCRQLRAVVWQSVSYPLVVIALGVAVMVFVTEYIIPRYVLIFADFDTDLPALTKLIVQAAPYVAPTVMAVLLVISLLIVALNIMRKQGAARRPVEAFSLSLPLIGPVIARNLTARWCNAMTIGVNAGLALLEAIELAASAIDSPHIERDSAAMAATLSQGRSLGETEPLHVIPATVPVAINLAITRSNLPETLDSLTQMYQRQTELRLNALSVALPPFLLIALGCVIGLVTLSLLLPLVKLITALT